MTAVSVVVITKNEERNIERCLESARWAAETVVVDAYSSDRTAELARRLGARVFERDWPGYGAQKNFGIAQANEPWILSLDADEEVTPALAREIEEKLSPEPMESAFRVLRPTFFMGRPLVHYGRAPRDPGLVRLFRKDRGQFDSRIVHEGVQVNGQVGTLAAPILHYCYPDLRTYWRKIHYYAHLEAKDRLTQGQVRGNRVARAAGKLLWMLFWRRGLLDGPSAWIWIAGQAYQEWLVTAETARLRHKESLHAAT
ncbi:MAG TPA: glycosyltransferase family 2 protein [Candidatus Dormibacteraeota bacterium]|nr:glycosyltransferase family 2 protein [Candidatus Dormibacteraeota bacterium]